MVKHFSHWLFSLTALLLAAALPTAGAYPGIQAGAASVPASAEFPVLPRFHVAPPMARLLHPPVADANAPAFAEPPTVRSPSGRTPAADSADAELPVPETDRHAESGTPDKPNPPVQPEPPDQPEQDVQLYETAAYYLNVRSGPGKGYSILRTVERGTILTVVEPTGNGWLKLQDEGYVHGAYAQPIPEKRTNPQTATASAPEGGRPAADARPLPPTSAVRSESGLDEEGIRQILKGTDLEGQELESAILEIEEEFGINAFFTIAVMKLESGNGSSRLARKNNNLFGLGATGGGNRNAYRFDTKADSVRTFGSIISRHYLGKGYTTIDKVARKYCPANSKWAKLVQSIMKTDARKVAGGEARKGMA
jgi:hypothetical protein